MTGAAAERFDVATLAAQRWKNGAGTTREIACSPVGADLEAFDWRLSVAEVERDAPFSAFPGIDRCIVLLRGDGMELLTADGSQPHRLDEPFRPWHFPGERALTARLLGGQNADFNVMTRRGRWHAEVRALRAGAAVQGGDATALLCGAGNWRVDSVAAFELQPMQGLLWRTPVTDLRVAPQGDAEAPCLLLVRLCHDHAA